MDTFNESELVRALVTLPERSRVAFAVAASTRQLGNYERFARNLGSAAVYRPREIVMQLWADLSTMRVDRDMWSARLDEVTGLLPDEDEDWTIWHALADDALSSLAYSIRCLLSLDAQESAWAARRAYEAADQAAIRLLAAQPGLPNTEIQIKLHPCVQRELRRQKNDLALLGAGSVEEIQRQRPQDTLLTESEAALLA